MSLNALQAIIPNPLDNLITYATAFAGSAALGLVKKYTSIADTKAFAFVKPVQPWLVLALSVVIPKLIHGTPNVPEASSLVAAPTATLLAVGAAEIIRRLFPRRP